MRLAVDAFNQAIKDEDDDSAREIAEYVVHNQRQGGFSAGFEFHCLRWLTQHYHLRYAQSEDNSTEEETTFSGLMDCIWLYKWLVQKLPRDIHLTREEIEEANEFMRRIYDDFQFSQASTEKTLMHQAIIMGDAERAKTHFAQWQQLEHDENNDCEACDQDSLVAYYDFIGDYTQALKAAEPILSGEMTCGEVPHITYKSVIHSLIALNRHDEAEALLDEAIDLITQDNEEHIILLPMLIVYLSQLGFKHEAADLLDEYTDEIMAISANNRLNYLEYLMCVTLFDEKALPSAQELAQEFDTRNGNSFYQDTLSLMYGTTTVH